MTKTLPEHLDFLCPYQSDLVRMGNSGDGGYLVSAKSIAKASHLLSIGISDDWTFEVEIAKANPAIAIDGYDRTSGTLVFLYYALKELSAVRSIRGLFKSAKKIRRWISLAISFKLFWNLRHRFMRKWVVLDSNSTKEIELSKVFERIPENINLAIKIDIEGNEYKLGEQIISEVKRRGSGVCLIIFEFHDTIRLRNEFLEFVKELTQYLKIVHLHGNKFGQIADDGFPEVVEITFASEAFAFEQKTLDFPHNLDIPCNPGFPDIAFKFAG
jgi:hypothetical protein